MSSSAPATSRLPTPCPSNALFDLGVDEDERVLAPAVVERSGELAVDEGLIPLLVGVVPNRHGSTVAEGPRLTAPPRCGE